jgi:hypothetical protein
MLRFLRDGRYPRRYETRQEFALMPHEPPRSTRSEPETGPRGLTVGEDVK